jgi:hypothetical protein
MILNSKIRAEISRRNGTKKPNERRQQQEQQAPPPPPPPVSYAPPPSQSHSAPPPRATGGGSGTGVGTGKLPQRTPYRVLISGLPEKTSWKSLKEFFETEYPVIFLDFRSPGNAIAEFGDSEQVEGIVQSFHGSFFQEKRLSVVRDDSALNHTSSSGEVEERNNYQVSTSRERRPVTQQPSTSSGRSRDRGRGGPGGGAGAENIGRRSRSPGGRGGGGRGGARRSRSRSRENYQRGGGGRGGGSGDDGRYDSHPRRR